MSKSYGGTQAPADVLLASFALPTLEWTKNESNISMEEILKLSRLVNGSSPVGITAHHQLHKHTRDILQDPCPRTGQKKIVSGAIHARNDDHEEVFDQSSASLALILRTGPGLGASESKQITLVTSHRFSQSLSPERP